MAEQNNILLRAEADQISLARKKQAVKAVDGYYIPDPEKVRHSVLWASRLRQKSTLGRTLIRMYEPTGGQIIF